MKPIEFFVAVAHVALAHLPHHPAAPAASRSETRPPLSPWSAIATCESGGDWSADTGNGFYGGLQIALPTWVAYGGTAYADRPDLATVGQQVEIATRVQAAQGWGAWPSCATQLGLS